MDEKDNLLLSEFLKLTTDFEKDPSEDSYDEIQEWLSKLCIRAYMPIKEKGVNLVRILANLDKNYDLPNVAMYIEINKVIMGLLSYCTNLTVDINYAITTGIYDNLQMYGLVSTIKQVCEEDYVTLCSMVDNAFNIGNVKAFADTAELLNETEYNKWIEAMNQFKDQLTPEIVEGLIAMGQMSETEFSELSKNMSATFVGEVNNALAAEKLRQEKIEETEKKSV